MSQGEQPTGHKIFWKTNFVVWEGHTGLNAELLEHLVSDHIQECQSSMRCELQKGDQDALLWIWIEYLKTLVLGMVI